MQAFLHDADIQNWGIRALVNTVNDNKEIEVEVGVAALERGRHAMTYFPNNVSVVNLRINVCS